MRTVITRTVGLDSFVEKKKSIFLFSVFAHHVVPWRFWSTILKLFYLRCTKLLSTLKAHSKVFHWNNLN